jgi:mRNA-degrading endonuclease YafQ of YafQ-DinJ toxin-antitoxin module
MIIVQYAPTFVRMYKGLDSHLKEEVKEKIVLFQDTKNHIKLKAHKLKGSLGNTYAFSVNYKIRIVFEYENKNIVNLLYVGSHDDTYR